MIHVTIYGLGTSAHERMKFSIKRSLEKGGVAYVIHDENSIEAFLDKQLESVPAVEVNGEILKTLNGMTDEHYIDNVLQNIHLKIKNNKDAVHNSPH